MESIREIDLAARYGGEEFAVVLPYTSREGALGAAERILEKIRSHQFSCDTTLAPDGVTASIGIAFSPSDADATEELILKADAMLYRAKRAGKNRVCIYDPTPGDNSDKVSFTGQDPHPVKQWHRIGVS